MELIKIKVKTNSPKSEIIKQDDYYKVYVKSPPEKNKANEEIIKLFYKKLKRRVRIVKGLKSKEKLLKFE